MHYPKHVVELYTESVTRTQNTQMFEGHFTSHKLEIVAMVPIPQGARPSNTTPPNEEEGLLDIESIYLAF